MDESKVDLNYIDFEKVVFGLEHILSRMELGKQKQIIFEYVPELPYVHISFRIPDNNGRMMEETWGDINRESCERFILFIGKKFVETFEIGVRQRVIVDYDPQNHRASVRCIK